MCTLSLIRPGPDSWRVRFNRDEHRLRPTAHAPVERQHGRVWAVYPIDPQSGGTWIAATSTGVAIAVLNQYGSVRASGVDRESRGLLIPRLLDATTAGDAARRAHGLRIERYRPFRLIAIDAREVYDMISDGRRLEAKTIRTDRWMCTSSAVRSAEIGAIRAATFERLVTTSSIAAQDCFHAHVCAARPEEGVWMSRADACTVSMTTIEVLADRVRMAYVPLES